MKKQNETEKLLKETIEKLIAELKQGHTEGFQNYLKFCSQFHNYSFNNRILIGLQCPNASHVAGYQDWKRLGRHVNEGEKSLKILMPLVGNEKDKHGEKTGKTFVYGYKETSVFDISQTSGKDIPNDCMMIPGDNFEEKYLMLCQIMKENNILVEEVDLGADCNLCGRSFGGKVQINKHLYFNYKLVTLVHEYAHELLHQGSENDSKNLSRALKEFEAESTAYVVCLMLGLEPLSSRDYILNWIKADDFDATKFSTNLNRVLKASSEIFEAVSNKVEQDVQLKNQEDQLKVA